MKYPYLQGLLVGVVGTAIGIMGPMALAQREVTPTPSLPPIQPTPVPATPVISSTQSSAALKLSCQGDGSIRVEVTPRQ